MIESSSTLAEAIGSSVVIATGVGVSLAAIGVALRRTLADRSPELRYGVALALWIVVAGTPLISASLTLNDAANVAESSARSSIVGLPLDGPTDGTFVPSTTKPGTWVASLATPWFLGAVGCYLWWILGLVGTVRTRFATRTAPLPLLNQLTQLREDLSIRATVALRLSERAVGPVLIGVLRPTIVIPVALATRLTPAQLEFIWIHELGHLVRRDNLVLVVQRLASPLTFFNPGAWFVARWLQEEREHCCDAWVLSHRNSPQD
ncbi:MAG: M56 family metallopeptidase, partial [Planctomycetota bacterium]